MLKDRIGRRSVLKAVTGGVPALLLSRGNPGGGRVEMLKSRLDSAPPRTVCLERARLMTESYRRTEGEPALIRRAKAFGAVLEGIPIQIGAGELIVGNVASAPRIPYFATETFDWRRYRPGADQVLEDERFSKAVSIRFRIPDDIADYWHNRPAGGHVGHFVADYSRVLRSGFAGLRAEIARQDRSDGRKHDFYEAAEIACRAAELFGARYAEQAGALARRQPDPARRYELERIAETCARV